MNYIGESRDRLLKILLKSISRAEDPLCRYCLEQQESLWVYVFVSWSVKENWSNGSWVMLERQRLYSAITNKVFPLMVLAGSSLIQMIDLKWREINIYIYIYSEADKNNI